MARGMQSGTCRICGVEGKLSYEHVPPDLAFNNNPVVLHTMQGYINAGMRIPERGGKIQQRGAGGYTLCEPCNRNTGKWYAREYARWAGWALEVLDRAPARHAGVRLTFHETRPLSFLKQAVTMIFSANAPTFSGLHLGLRAFVLDKESNALPSKYNVFLTLTRGSIARSVGVGGVANTNTGETLVLSEIAFPPFAILMTFDQEERSVQGHPGCITHLRRYRYNEVTPVDLVLPIGELATIYPDDYRTRAEVDREAARATQEF